MNASIIIVGDEILSGHVRDANAHFIATRLSEHGHCLRGVSIVSDHPSDIGDVLLRDLDDSRIELIFVCGGLGPTHDDRTMEAIALALGVELERCEPIAERIQAIAERVKLASFEGDPLGMDGLMKMAYAPAGARALSSSSGVIPAFTLMHASKSVVVLPGPPRELEAVFRESVEPMFLEGTGQQIVRDEIEHRFPESALAMCLTEAENSFPGAKIGSYPLPDRVLIRIAGTKDAVEGAAEFVRDGIATLSSSDDGKRLLEIMRQHQ
ncbi:MAG: competence/damage-inducible protein A [Actinomycetota bacterium]